MKVFLPAITGHCPPQMVRAVGSFLEFCYLVRRSVLDDTDLEMIEKTIKAFHDERLAFEEVRGTNPSGYSLPRQHSITHYALLIKEFGAPNGLCSSITESKHIKAVKEPWRRSNKYEALGQMLLTNQRLDKLAAARVKFAAKGLLRGPINPLVRFLDDDSNFGPAATPTSVGLPQAGTENNEDADDGGDVDGNVLGDVKLANKPSASPSTIWLSPISELFISWQGSQACGRTCSLSWSSSASRSCCSFSLRTDNAKL